MIDILTYMVAGVSVVGLVLLAYLLIQIYSTDTYTRDE
jgi:hypothetical protein